MKLMDLEWAVKEAEIKYDLAPETFPMTHPDKEAAAKELRLARKALEVFKKENE